MPPYMHHLPYWLPHSATDSPLSLVHPLDQSAVPDPGPSCGTPAAPGAPSAVSGLLVDPEKKDPVPVPPSLYPAGGAAAQPAVQRFKVALPHSQRAADVSPAPPPASPHVDTQAAANSGLSSPLCPAIASASVAPASATGTPSAGPPAAPGPPQSPSPAVPPGAAAYSEGSAYSSSTPGNAVSVQQVPQQQQQQQLLGCGACGCHNNCGGRTSMSSNGSGSASSCQAPVLFAGHQMAAARQVFSGPPPLFQLANLCSSSYLPQAQPQPPHQVNGTAALSPFFASAPPHYGPLHSQNPAEVPSHLLGMQAVAAVAAANYNLHQQMAASASSLCQRVYQQQMYPNLLSMVPAATLPRSGANKKSGSVSCYNCGVSGHYAQECHQLSKDSTQGRGTIRRDNLGIPGLGCTSAGAVSVS